MRQMMDTARAMVASGKGLLAMDESTHTCNQRFASVGIPHTLEMRRAYRELLLTAPGLSDCVSGVILFDETIRQTQLDGKPLVQLAKDAGLIVGIKVDIGAQSLAGHPGEKVTEGLDGLRERLQAYAEMGARFAKWRGVIAIETMRLPTPACIDANSHALARYAALCQEVGLVPIIEPEVLMLGVHTQARCQAVTEKVLRCVFAHLALQGVVLEAMVLKSNMVIAGLSCHTQNTAQEVAEASVQCLLRAVPAAVAGITFLSGGQSGELASSRLNAMHTSHSKKGKPAELPWPLSFSFARAIQHPALEIWAGKALNREAAQAALVHRARCNSAALSGHYSAAMETNTKGHAP
jgi:fructose-bisphosphate aldolase class I